MKLTRRESIIINKLKQNPNGLSGNKLAKILKVSTKTIQNDIRGINCFFDEQIIESSNRGYVLIVDEINPNLFSYEEDISSRNNQILEKILLKNSEYNYSDLANSLNVSESNLQLWIKECNDFLLKYSLKINRSKGYVFLSGKEINKRKLINHMIHDELNSNIYKDNEVLKYYDKINEDELLKVLNDFLENERLRIAPYYQTSIYLNLLSVFERIINKLQIETADIKVLKSSAEYKLALELCSYVSSKYTISIIESEVYFIASLFVGQLKDEKIDSSIYVSTSFVEKVDSLLLKTFNHYMLDSKYNDFLLVFARHVYDLIKRATVSHQIPNPFSSSLKDNCPFIYDVAVYLSQLIECEFGIHMSEAEINLVAIHIGYSIDDMNNDKKIKCIIYNSVYQNNERVIVHKILNKFRGMLNIIEVKNDFSQLLKECSAQPDVLFISTVSNVPIRENLCTISPIVSEKDIDKVYNCIESLRKLDERFSLRELIKKYTDSDLFYTSINYSNRDDLIYYLANDLFNKNIVSETFATSVIERENKSSTCFFNKFSIPHALDLNAKKTAISVVISERSINWGNSEIYVVFLIAISNKDMNLFSKMYDGLISSILEDRIFERLSKAKDYEGFLNCF